MIFKAFDELISTLRYRKTPNFENYLKKFFEKISHQPSMKNSSGLSKIQIRFDLAFLQLFALIGVLSVLRGALGFIWSSPPDQRCKIDPNSKFNNNLKF